MLKVKLKGDAVEDNGKKREVEFYDDFDIMGDDGRALFTLRLREGGVLEVSSGGMCVMHGGAKLSEGLIVRPASSGRVTLSRDKYEG